MTVMRAQDFEQFRYLSSMQCAGNGSGKSRPFVRLAPFHRSDLRSACRGLPSGP